MLENQYQDTESSMTMTAGPTEDHARIAHEDAWNASRKGKFNMPENISMVNTSMLLTIKVNLSQLFPLLRLRAASRLPSQMRHAVTGNRAEIAKSLSSLDYLSPVVGEPPSSRSSEFPPNPEIGLIVSSTSSGMEKMSAKKPI